EPLHGHPRGSAAVVPDAGDVPLEFPSQGISADRGTGRARQVPVLQRGIRPVLTSCGMSAQRLTVVQLVPALEAGGAERSTLEVARALVAAGHRSIVVS